MLVKIRLLPACYGVWWDPNSLREGGREGGRAGGREGEKEREREGGRVGGWEGGRESTGIGEEKKEG